MTPQIENKKARLEYEFLETFEAGMVLTGYEAKSLRVGKASLVGAHVVVRGGEAYLVGATISPYQEGNVPKNYDPERSRKLLLSKKQLQGLVGAESQKGLTLVPIMILNQKRHIKLAFALARKKKKHDKRASLKERDDKRSMDRAMKGS